jgi:hypothetical protein
MKIRFTFLAEAHFPLLLKWLEAPHVKKWWDQNAAYTMELVREKYSSYIKGYNMAVSTVIFSPIPISTILQQLNVMKK